MLWNKQTNVSSWEPFLDTEKGSVTHGKGGLSRADPALCPEPASGDLSLSPGTTWGADEVLGTLHTVSFKGHHTPLWAERKLCHNGRAR